jgi:predicted transcriptional regulator
VTLPNPDELAAQYEAGQIELEAAFLLLLQHVRLLYQLKELDILVLNGLLQDVEAIAEELKLERPSAAMRIRLLEWVKQIEEAAGRQAERRANSSD